MVILTDHAVSQAYPATCFAAFGEVVKTISFQFAPPDPSSPRQLALRESLPSPIQMMLLLSAAVSANKLEFLNVGVADVRALKGYHSHNLPS